MATPFIDPVLLTRDLIRKPSVTPVNAGAIEVVAQTLESLGFTCRRMDFDGIVNLYARLGAEGPNLCFAGHTDVVPPGPESDWSRGPFEAEVVDGMLYGRGAVDMKGGIAAWIAAVAERLAKGGVPGSLSFLITGDEEGRATHGTKLVVQALKAEGERIDHCIVGEPSSQQRLGDCMKIGRRGSLNVWITARGRQGHVAYPERGANPIPVLVRLLNRLEETRLDEGYEAFQPSNLELTTIDVDNPATNVIPAVATARLNIRFNPARTGADLIAWLEDELRAAEGGGVTLSMETLHSGDAFLTPEGDFTHLVQDAVEAELGVRPTASTTGGTSDARFIKDLCPVLELGLVGQTMHQIDERVPEAELRALAGAYGRVIDAYFARFSG
ncbi:succinyl-diaminopimelate desuccinylase [Brevundimonas sp. 2R-24]|uniref:Succinyl-diaminopimelate desuccinylase n=1 Tax=Peiella sedimenti TaxID=3061083 RepID=A0ABT8SLG1_9CAUL|nr:succinyl-diaminopimelate desuccinylase [Caulobacteraceae bacterium XZ-24]